MVTPEQLGERLLALRHRHGLTQEALAEAAEVSPKTVQRLERGSIAPSLETLGKLAAAFGLSASELLAEELEACAEIVGMVRTLPPLERELARVVIRSLHEHRLAAR